MRIYDLSLTRNGNRAGIATNHSNFHFKSVGLFLIGHNVTSEDAEGRLLLKGRVVVRQVAEQLLQPALCISIVLDDRFECSIGEGRGKVLQQSNTRAVEIKTHR